MLGPMRDPPQTQTVIVARCCSGVHSVSTPVWVTGAANAAPSPQSVIHTRTHTHTHIHIQYTESFHSKGWIQCKVLLNIFWHIHMYLLSIWQEQREEKGGRGDVVQYSLVDVAGHYAELQGVLIYYCGQWSMKSWRRAERAQIPFLHPHAAHVSPHTPALPAPVPLSALSWPCPAPAVPSSGPGPQHATCEAAQLQRISCSLSRPGGLSLQRGRKSRSMVRVWWHNKSLGKQLQGSEHHDCIYNQWKGIASCSSFHCVLHERTLVMYVDWRGPEQTAVLVLKAEDSA